MPPTAAEKQRSGTAVSREGLLKILNSVSPGTTKNEKSYHSACFVFHEGDVITFDGESLACRAPTGFPKKISKAVKADKLLAFLNKSEELDLAIEFEESRLVVKEKVGTAWFALEEARQGDRLRIPIDRIPLPDVWKPLPDNFSEAVEVVQQCCSDEDGYPFASCVHIHPKFLEAVDRYQMCRWRMRTKVENPLVVDGGTIRQITPFGMTEFAESERWIQFRNPSGLVMSCLLSSELFPEMDSAYKVEGEPAELPKTLENDLKKAALFAAENPQHNFIRVNLTPGRMWIIGQGVTCGYEKPKAVKYQGKPLSFLIKPDLLSDLVKRDRKCVISEKKIKVQNDHYEYVSCLAPPTEAKKSPERNGKVEKKPHEEEE